MKVEYSKKAEAIYIQLIEGDYELTTEELVADVVLVDKTPLQQIYGIEILGVKEILVLPDTAKKL